MQVVTIPVFEFDELSVDAKAVAMSHFSDINIDHDWWQLLFDEFHAEIAEYGLQVDDFEFDLNEEHFNFFNLRPLDSGSPRPSKGEPYLCTLGESFFSRLKERFEYLISEEAVCASIRANDFRFTGRGQFLDFSRALSPPPPLPHHECSVQ